MLVFCYKLMFIYLVEEKAWNLSLNSLTCFFSGCQLPSLYIFIHVTIYISISYKYIRIYIRVVEVSFFELKHLKQYCLSSASSRLLLPYKVLFFFPPPPCFRECAVVVEEEVSDDVAYRAGMVFILSHYENIFILLSNTDADIE